MKNKNIKPVYTDTFSPKTKTSGNLCISKYVIMKIAEIAASEIPGVALYKKNKLARLIAKDLNEGMFSPKLAENGLRMLAPVKVGLTEFDRSGDALDLSVYIIVVRGFKAVKVALAVQKAVKENIQNITGIPVAKVNVKIAGLVEKDDAEED